MSTLDHVSLRPDDARHECGVVARPGADLENAVPGTQVELREHDRHHRRLGGRARRDAVDGLGGDGLVRVGPCERHPGQEQVPRHGRNASSTAGLHSRPLSRIPSTSRARARSAAPMRRV